MIQTKQMQNRGVQVVNVDSTVDKLSILDIKATDQSGAIYGIEMQLSIFKGLIQRIVFYGCEVYADSSGRARTTRA